MTPGIYFDVLSEYEGMAVINLVLDFVTRDARDMEAVNELSKIASDDCYVLVGILVSPKKGSAVRTINLTRN